jgi:hypothetical protein
MTKIPSVSASLRFRWFGGCLCLALLFTASCKNTGDEFDGEHAAYGPRTPTTKVNSTLTFSPGSLLGSASVAQSTAVVGQKTVNGASYDRLATTRTDDPSKNGEYWIKDNSDNTVDFAGYAHSSLVGGIVPAASMTLTTPVKVNLDAPLNQAQTITASGTLAPTDGTAPSPATITGQYTLVEKDATVATGVGPLSGCSHFTGQAASTSAGIPAAFQGQTIKADLYYHPSYGVVAFNTPDLGIGTAMTETSDCGSADSSGYKIIRKVGVVDATTSFKLDTYDCDGNQFAADMNTHAKMLLELRWVDETQAKTDLQPPSTVNFGPSTVEFGVASGNIFGFTLAEAPASVFHPEENGKGFKYWYAYVSEADKNEDTASNHTTSYHISVSSMSSAVRVTARIYYKVLSSAIGVQPGGGQIAGNKDAGGTGGVTGTRLDGGIGTGNKDAGVKADATDGSVLDAPADSVDATVASSCNLIVNGNAEAAIGSIDGTPVSTPGWTSTGEATAGQYGVNGWPGPTDPGPIDRGLNLFSGGVADATSSLTQTINVAQFAGSIDGSRVTYQLSGWLGGWQSQDDNATLTATFQNASGVALSTGTIGPVLAADRGYATGLVQQLSSGAVPAGTRTVLVVLSMTRMSGTANDGYADDLSLIFSGTGSNACTLDASAGGGTCVTGPGTPLTLSGAVTTIAGSAPMPGSADGTGPVARFNYPYAIATDGTNLYVVDTYNDTIRKIVISTGVVTTIAGSVLLSGSADGTGSAARFNLPNTIATDGANLYVTDAGNSTIRKIVISTGVVTTIAGSAGMSGSTDGTGSAARFYRPSGIATDNTNLFVADYGNNTIRKIVISTGVVTTIAGSPGVSGATDGIGTAAHLNGPTGITTDNTNLFVTENTNETIRKIVISTGAVTTIAGSPGLAGSTDGVGSAARFNDPAGITTDGTNLYVCDTLNHTIRKVDICTGAVTTIAGSAGLSGSVDGVGAAARFDEPFFLTSDGTSLYVADEQNSTIRKISGGSKGQGDGGVDSGLGPASNGPDGGARAVDASADSKGTAGTDAVSTCGIGSAPAPVGTFDDDFSLGLRPLYWTVAQTTAGLYSVDSTQGDVRLAKVGSNSAGILQNVVLNLNMQNIGGPVAGDFELSVDFSNAVLGSGGTDQIELHAFFEDSSYFYDVYDNSSGVNVHVWTGSIQPGFSTTVTGGTFRIVRSGATVSAYLNTSLVWSSPWTTGRLSGATFVLQLQPGSDDNESVRFDNFHLKGGCISP